MPRLYGQHIMLREYDTDDYQSIRAWVNDAQTCQYLSPIFWCPQSSSDTQDFLQKQMQASHNAYNFVIAGVENGQYLGQLDILNVNHRLKSANLGLVIGQAKNRGKGYASEALMLATQFVFEMVGLERFELEVMTANKSAIRCYEKAGFQHEGIKRHAYYANGDFCDVAIMSILRSDYLASKQV